jgi:RimJ/RimL family protein N-acetyltransferase
LVCATLTHVVVRFEPLTWPGDEAAVVDFLVASEWPFHPTPLLSPEQAARVCVSADDVASIWILDDGAAMGLIRLMDLTDLDDGSPLFDLRIAEGHRGRGVGGLAVSWLTDHLFTTYPQLHRIEATTRDDNVSMQAVFDRCGYRQEGRFVEAWLNGDDSRSDALSYAILRREWTESEPATHRT